MIGSETAFAKLNLALHVRGREPDGYHRLETLFAFCEDGDTVALAGEGAVPLAITGEFADGLSAGPDNLVRRAADGIAALFGLTAPPLTLVKRLPVAAGIGGGSADAAAALRLIARINGIDPGDARLMTLAATLGADVPACLVSRPVLGLGRGDVLAPAGDAELAGLPVLLVNPRVPLATGPVFAAWDRQDRGPLGPDWRTGRNDLQAPAVTLVPMIADVLAALAAQPGVTLARMSGSGATCFALFADEAARDAAAVAIDRRWWRLATRLRTLSP
ncbi:4-(cytidine 5'-diphospho)-2-C-methyl-D-erythritol kinase [Sphingomonas quercus]|uniref:4-(cytidine 5'-diphospho)-2-C-methyl-D-erythritol kinase n=1 Tax=Sphingomonas quercus TaxID=2842451 RepID=UPI003F4DC1C5